jgi:hypothetical protein
VKRILFALSFATFVLLTGCDKKVSDVELPVQTKPDEQKEMKVLEVDPAKFHFVADWLTDSEILFVEKDNGYYYVKSFNLESAVISTLHEEAAIINDVLIHPSKNFILLHTTDNSSSATIKILSLDGTLHDEVSIESSELAIEWNDLDPSLLLLTAFHQDWSYDVFLYNGNDETFGLIDINDPFAQWFGSDQIISSPDVDHPLDGGELHIYRPASKEWERTNKTGIVYFDTYKESLLTVQITDQGNAYYSVLNQNGMENFSWTSPAVSNYSEWVFPDVAWVSEESIYIASAKKGGQQDEIGPYHLLRVTAGQQEQENIDVDTIPSLLRCSPKGEFCLTGYAADTIINTKTADQILWLSFPE